MRLLYMTTAALALTTTAAFADRPAGWQATGCDGDSYTRVVSERTGETLYWNNPTCPAGSGPTDAVAEPEEPENEPEAS